MSVRRINQMCCSISYVLLGTAILACFAGLLGWDDASAQAPAEARTGIELLGRAGKAQPLASWFVYDATKPQAKARPVNGQGFTPLPPGEYVLNVQPQGYSALELRWKQVTVKEGEVIPVKVDSGVELLGRADKAPPLAWWYVYDATKPQGKAVAQVSERWGFTPLPPGQYVLSVQPPESGAKEVRCAEVEIVEGKVATVETGRIARPLSTARP